MDFYPTDLFSPPPILLGSVLKKSESHRGPRRFHLRRMEFLSRKSSDSCADDTAITGSSSTLSSTPGGLKRQPNHAQLAHDPTSCMTTSPNQCFDDTQFSDLIVRCREEVYHVHRAILCSHSQWFSKVCAKVPPDSIAQTIDLSADDPDAVDAMLQFCYQLDYADRFLGLSSAVYTIYTLEPHIDIYLLAERFKMPGLQQLAVEKFETRASVLSRTEVSKDKFFQAIRVIYASTRAGEDDLRKAAVRLCADHAEQYVLRGDKTAARVFKLMDEFPSFRMDFIKELAARLK